jgi:hypothetical protein
MPKAIGRILNATDKYARVELGDEAEVERGSLIEFIVSSTKITAKIEKLENHKYAGLIAHVYFLDPTPKPPKPMTEIFLSEDFEDGILYVGSDRRGVEVRINLNPLFGHLLVAGMTKAGKTHFMLVLLECLVPLGVPMLVIDTHGEFINLVKRYPDSVVLVEELRIEDLISYLQQRKTVIYDLLGMEKVSKANRISEVLNSLYIEKEKDYRKAENNPMLLSIPPALIFVDEAEVYAPNNTATGNVVRSGALDALIQVAKEGAKFGLGLIAAPQRVSRLHVDVRGQMNSAAIFRLTDYGSKRAVREMDFILKQDMELIGAFEQGECILTGHIVRRPRIVHIRDIQTERAKKINYEEMLGIERTEGLMTMNESFIEITPKGVVDIKTQKIIQSRAELTLVDDKLAFEMSDGDGVVRREEPLTDEELQQMVPFNTHLTDEDMKLAKQLRKLNQENDM